ncbi:beta-ketoacyl synthase N-terminal-like domain-containing protein [Goodfellowiella coeruleoviolacea]|uniref:3-oxoacyl-[acyl-carrier-protein] synthase II n=1 Tax=Goodfellowiella coeruleoviolacea TaxID=334858 RepID=A0AAE3GF27_9PSEU|nr:beta-ketoacyl synthase N-terminal-like domain-containing protein [Goodfellowiella coeruleoviolacea]MCP2167072.1 3-oxoacyl-[acyl-carrier-protein] synthase II [Goodfellowiella coeruleoviolacea]
MSTPVITAWSAVSAFGIGRAAFDTGLAAPVGGVAGNADTREVPGFDIRDVLGPRGTRSMDRLTGLTLAAVAELVGEHAAVAEGTDTALVLGTTTGSAQSAMAFTRSSLEAERPFYVDPAVVPNGVMNRAAGQAAIRHRLIGPNTTIAGGRVAALQALQYAGRLLGAGRAGTVLAGGVEELTPARLWLERNSAQGRHGVIGEGGAFFAVTTDARHALADVLAVRSLALAGDDQEKAMRRCVTAALARAGVPAAEVWAVAPGNSTVELFDDAVVIAPEDRLGETGAASGALQLAAVLSTAARTPGAAGRIAVIASVEHGAVVACAVLRLRGRS